MEFSFPRRFGRYVLVDVLGVGGMGEVLLALRGTRGSEERCVVKRLYPEARGDKEAEERFRREGELVLKLDHPAIARTIEVGEEGGEIYIAQEFVAGRDLFQVISAGAEEGRKLPVELSIHIVSEIARALAYVHDLGGLGLVHRDVGPANIRLSFAGDVKLLDFGIARAAAQPYLTRTGQVIGRPAYTAPEVQRGGKADKSADVYSLGAVLWELLAGRHFPPMDKLCEPSRHRAEISGEIDQVVMKALARKTERFQDAHALRAALGRHIPKGYDGAKALRDLLAGLVDVERERSSRDEEIRRAARLLPVPDEGDGAKRDAGDEPGPSSRRPPSGKRWVLIATGAALASAASLWFATRSPYRAPGHEVAAVMPGHKTASMQVEGAEGGGAGTARAPAPLMADPAPQADTSTRIHVASEPRSKQMAPKRTKRVRVVHGRPVGEPSKTAGPSEGKPAPAGNEETAGDLLQQAKDAFSAGDVERALTLADQGVTRGGGARAYYLRGAILFQKGRYPDAVQDLEEAVRRAPEDDRAKAALERARGKLGNP